MSERTILALDPSKTATGWVVYDLDREEIVDRGCFCATMDKKEKKKYSRKTEIYEKEQLSYVEFLTRLKVRYGIDKVVTEYPHGSQSARASWALSMVNSTVQTFTQLVLGVPAVTYLESDCKKANFGKSKGIEKEDTIELMMAEYESYDPPRHGGKVTKYKNEAICDALLVLNTYLNE